MLSVTQLSKKYADKTVLDDVSFNIAPGEIVALLGANGSGKTTTINSICQLIEYDAGDIQFGGQSIQSNRQYLSQIGAVLGGSRNINWRLTASQNAEYFAALRGHSGKAVKHNIAQLQQRLGLDKYAKLEVLKLSTGNKQKAALLSALAYSPKLLLLDEPTLGLDLDTVQELQDIIGQQSSDSDQAFLITSHDMSFIDKICQKVIVIDQGKVIFSGTIDALKNTLYSYKLRAQLANSVDEVELEKNLHDLCAGRYQLQFEQNVLRVDYETPEQVMPLLSWLHTQNICPTELSITPLQMEDAFRSLTQAAKQEEKS